MNKNGIQQIKRLFALCLTVLSCSFPSISNAQDTRVSIDMENVAIERVMGEIEKQTNYLFMNKGVDVTRKVNVSMTNRPVKEVLDQMFRDAGIGYDLDGNYIILSVRKDDAGTGSVSGIVSAESGPVIGAAVFVAGTSKGVTTDQNGKYLLTDVVRGETIRFSYLGYETAEVVYAGQSNINITLRGITTDLEEVVVTALGIKREQKALSYNVQQIKSDDITAIKDANFINSLSGKVAGAAINSSSSGVGGAVKVVLRGVKSIEQTNNALYVIDGIPMFNFGGGGEKEFGSKGETEAIADINPEDIESISVLTGASAAALYGSNAANGAILITTKRGEAGKFNVTASTNIEFMNPFVLPKFQNRYGTGSMGQPSGSSIYSWGPLLNSAARTGYTPGDFFETGAIYTNSVTMSGGSDKNQMYFSAAALNSDGIIPNNKYNRYNFNFRNTSHFLDDRLRLDVSATYVVQDDQNMTNQGIYSNPLVPAYLFPRGDDFELTKIFERYDPARKIMTQYWPQGEGGLRMQNPYWIAHRNLRQNDKRRYMLSAALSYDVLDWLNVSGRARVDNTDNLYTQKLFASSESTITEGGSKGHYTEERGLYRQTYADVLVNIDKRFDDFSLVANIGASINNVKSDKTSNGGPISEKDGIANVFTIAHLDKAKSKARRERWQEQTQSVFASVELGWRSMLFLTVTGRNDWASQLANSPQSSFFYPSVGLSAVVTEMGKMPDWLTFLKVRGSFSSVGMPFPRFLTIPTYEYVEGSGWAPVTHYPMGKLYPERTDSWEVGFDGRFFRDFTVSASFYMADTKNQTFDPDISVSSGYSKMYLQTGHVRNTGVELMLGYGHTWNKFRWDTGFTFSWNKNEIKQLVDNYTHPITGMLINKDELEIKGLGKAKYILKKGGTIGDLYTTSSLKLDDNGYVDIDDNGDVVTIDNLSEAIKLGSVLPKYNMAWRNNFSWNGIHLGVVFTGRVGGVVYSATQAYLDQFGVSNQSAAARDAGGALVHGRSRVEPQKWYSAIAAQSGIPQYYTYSATNFRLQEASIGYTIPRSKLGDVVSITVSLVGRNLWMIYNEAPFDPESVATTDNHYMGIDYFMMPSTRNIGFNLKFQF